ncbi:MAG: 50S ribosomal protein L3 [Candidatus Nomurabacteria bacterium]|jgi:large subunit ribosomal protein L3|nr:50S ribosomal protein L3 [Candidatus Nomurabacteria bacterium]
MERKGASKMKAILGTKVGMTQIISADGVVTPVTILQAGPCTVTQTKSVETDGYSAVQMAYGQGKNLSKAVSGHVKKTGKDIKPKFVREIRTDNIPEEMTLGSEITVETFALGDKVQVTGISKGKGFAGTIKRHNFHESKHTHGGNGNVRRVGSIGSMYPQKVMRGKKMPGRMGHDQVTVKNLVIAYIDATNNLIGIKGAVPGPNKGLIVVEGKE